MKKKQRQRFSLSVYPHIVWGYVILNEEKIKIIFPASSHTKKILWAKCIAMHISIARLFFFSNAHAILCVVLENAPNAIFHTKIDFLHFGAMQNAKSIEWLNLPIARAYNAHFYFVCHYIPIYQIEHCIKRTKIWIQLNFLVGQRSYSVKLGTQLKCCGSRCLKK